jgi:hypothetical protein
MCLYFYRLFRVRRSAIDISELFLPGVQFLEVDTEKCVFALPPQHPWADWSDRRRHFSISLAAASESKINLLRGSSAIRSRISQIVGKGPSRQYGSLHNRIVLTLEAFWDCSMEKALDQTPSSDENRNALLRKKGPKGHLRAAVIAYEQGDWDALIQMRIDPEKIAKAYLDSVAWGEELLH